MRKNPYGMPIYFFNIFESGVYELRENKFVHLRKKFEIIVKYMAVKKIKIKKSAKNNYLEYIPLHML